MEQPDGAPANGDLQLLQHPHPVAMQGNMQGGTTTRRARRTEKAAILVLPAPGEKREAIKTGFQKYTHIAKSYRHTIATGRGPDRAMADGRIYVGNLPTDVQERDIEDLFFKYGKIRDIELKNNRGTIPFAFVRFEDPRDAEDAVYGRNGYGFGDCKLRVEYPRSSASKFSGPMGGGPRGRFGPPTRRSEFRVIVTGRWKPGISTVPLVSNLSAVEHKPAGWRKAGLGISG
ncbi:hypothetical protein ANANG_G00187750 [Anguilla anguilla]|uniref:RRM domain-containing protein n=1 Tax=Anguilla anguilla TaxID=7936 RepID=A0A9D3M2C2_ANGAN|nr:hypothetical protein ANANG_G00187750 [Anguilla anguilla]